MSAEHQNKILSDYLLANHQEEFGANGDKPMGEGAGEMAIRLLRELTGRLNEWDDISSRLLDEQLTKAGEGAFVVIVEGGDNVAVPCDFDDVDLDKQAKEG